MKALMLAAGFGIRLLPFTKNIPKALFPVSGRPLLDTIILNLENAGCKAIIINTHHLYKEIDSYLSRKKYAIPVITRYEPEILGTGGAIKNVADFWDDNPFIVINSDIVTDIDLKKVYDFHLNHKHPVTLVLHDDPRFNTVSVNKNGFITKFHDSTSLPSHPASGSSIYRPGETGKLTFTGIQVLDPQVLELIPDNILNEEQAQIDHGQTLSRLNERGGLSPCEAIAIIEKRRWHKMDLKEAIDKLKEYINND